MVKWDRSLFCLAVEGLLRDISLVDDVWVAPRRTSRRLLETSRPWCMETWRHLCNQVGQIGPRMLGLSQLTLRVGRTKRVRDFSSELRSRSAKLKPARDVSEDQAKRR